MSILDQPNHWAAVDPESMRSLLNQLPGHVREAAAAARLLDIPPVESVGSIVVSGLGGSAIGGDLARSVAGSELRKPYFVNRDYELPPFVDRSTLVFACSYSGNTEETLSAYNGARRAEASIICITSGGSLGERAKSDGYPVLALPAGLPPRAALGYSLFTLLGALEKLRYIPDMTVATEETVGLLETLSVRYGPDNPELGNAAKKMARSLYGRIVAVYGSGSMLDAVAYRWRSQVAENAKTLAFHHALPEMNHNELVGWRCPEAILKHVGVVLLRDKGDHPKVQRRFELTKEILEQKAGVLLEAWSEGESLLARVMSLILLGDYVSLYLAYLNSVDPTPVDVIDYLKGKLSVNAN